MITKDFAAVFPCLPNWWWQTEEINYADEASVLLILSFPPAQSEDLPKYLYPHDVYSSAGRKLWLALVVQVCVWKNPFPWQGRRIFDRRFFKMLSSCIHALKIQNPSDSQIWACPVIWSCLEDYKHVDNISKQTKTRQSCFPLIRKHLGILCSEKHLQS